MLHPQDEQTTELSGRNFDRTDGLFICWRPLRTDKKELAASNLQKKIRIMYRDPETQEEVEIDQDYMDKKFESRVEFANSKAFEDVSYQFLLFYMLLCFLKN